MTSSDSKVKEYFPGIGKILYKPDATPNDLMCFKYYNPDEKILERTMKDWLRYSVAYWHTFRGTGADPFGGATLIRPWNESPDTVCVAKRRLDAAFEFFTKLGVGYYTFHDRDISPEGETLAETNSNLDEVAAYALQLQERTGVQLLWATCNLFAHARYMHGAATSPDAHVFAYAAAQVKQGLLVAKRLGAENFVFWGGREGFATLLNTDVKQEMDQMAAFFRMVVAYKKEIGFSGQLLIEPKPKEPTSHQYDYDAMSVIAFLQLYNLASDFKLNIEPNHTTLAGHAHSHDVKFASAFKMLGSIDANTGSPDLGWDTDQFPMQINDCAQIMQIVLQQGGLAPGGLNFDCKVRRESVALSDIFMAHIGAMDSFARGLRAAAKMQIDGIFSRMISDRYASFRNGIGAMIINGNADLQMLEDYIHKNGEPSPQSGQQEAYETLFNRYL